MSDLTTNLARIAQAFQIINGGGGLTPINHAYGLFQVKRSSQQTGFTSGTWVKILYNQVRIDTENAWDATNSQFVCPKTGWWELSGSGYVAATSGLASSAGGAVQNMAFTKNGVPGVGVILGQPVIPTIATGANVGHEVHMPTTMIALTVGDTVAGYGNLNTAGGGFFDGSPTIDLTFMRLKWVGV